MAAQELSTEEHRAALGKSVLAARVSGGKVPNGCLGLSIEGEFTQRYVAGKNVSAPRFGKLWWVHPGPYELCFAPVDAAPEAGVRLALEVEAPGGLVTDYLAYWLDACNRPVFDLADIESDLRGNPLLHPPPCLQPEEKRRISQGISAALIRRMGIRCHQFDREDLFPDINCAANAGQVHYPREVAEGHIDCSVVPSAIAEGGRLVGTSPLSDDVLPDATEIPVVENSVLSAVAEEESLGVSPLRDDIVTSSSINPGRAPSSREELLSSAIACDARFERRLFIELPRLAELLGGQAWPNDQAAFETQRALLRRLQYLSSTTGRLPSLEDRIDPRGISATTMRLLVAESRRATEGLDEAWSLLEGQAEDQNANPAMQHRLEQVVMTIEQAVARRKNFW